MSFNQFMHPRNIYRQKIDYEQLANEFEEFRKCLSYDSNGKCFIDYDNVETLKLLTKTLLQKDFNLNVQIPNDRLVPTLPMRLNYILWIEDLLNHLNISHSSTSISAIDIGTGSCAIFPLLSVVMNPNWKFIATEIDSVNLKFAQDNVRNNNLMNKIQIYDNGHTDTLFKHLLQTHDLHFTFIMSNPPFFDDTFNDSFENIDLNDHSQNDTKATKTKKYFHNKKLQTTSPNEAINENGGELSFIMKIIQESFETKNLIDLYTVMIGRKKTFLQLKSFLKENVEQHKLISSYSYTELCQGYTKRWALAWTFNNGYDLKNSPRIKQIKSKPLIYYLDDNSRKLLPEYTLKSVGNFIENLLINDLNIEQFTKIELNKRIEFDIKSNVASWKNQRRKRRQEKQHSFEDGDSFSNGKRLLNDDNSTDQQHHQSTANCLKNRKVTHTNEKCKMNLTYLLHCSLIIKRDKQDIYIKMETKQMSQNKSSTYELLQYFKNKLTINHSD